MISVAEFYSYIWIGKSGDPVYHIDSYLSCGAYLWRTFLWTHILGGNAVYLSDLGDYLFYCQRNRLVVWLYITDYLLSHIERGSRASNKRQCVYLSDCSFKLSYVCLELVRKKIHNAVGKIHSVKLSLTLDYCNSCFIFRRCDVRKQALLETAYQSLFDTVQLFGRSIRGEYDLLVLIIEAVECVEQLLLSFAFICHKLNIIY